MWRKAGWELWEETTSVEGRQPLYLLQHKQTSPQLPSPAEPRQSPHPGSISEITCLGLEGDLKSGREREAR